MTAFRAWDGPPPPDFTRFWFAMLEECNLLGSGALPDWQERLSEHFRRQMEAGHMRWFVAEENGRIVGTAAAILAHEGSYIFRDPMATLAGIYVDPAFRKRGIARELTQRAIAWCRELGCASVRLRASAAGRPLYESLGFVPGDEMVLSFR
jgi:GNAT superfamily N-acetyltransferase